MSEHEKQTEFLKECLRYEESTGRQKLEQEISQIQRDERCVQRAVWLMAGLTALAVAGFVYPTILLENFPYSAPPFIVNLVCALGMGAAISLLAFVGLGKVYRKKLDQRREECRQLVTRLLTSRLGKPVNASWRESRVGDGRRETVSVSAGDNGSPDPTESTAQG